MIGRLCGEAPLQLWGASWLTRDPRGFWCVWRDLCSWASNLRGWLQRFSFSVHLPPQATLPGRRLREDLSLPRGGVSTPAGRVHVLPHQLWGALEGEHCRHCVVLEVLAVPKGAEALGPEVLGADDCVLLGLEVAPANVQHPFLQQLRAAEREPVEGELLPAQIDPKKDDKQLN